MHIRTKAGKVKANSPSVESRATRELDGGSAREDMPRPTQVLVAGVVVGVEVTEVF
jgi:hypothetical protein